MNLFYTLSKRARLIGQPSLARKLTVLDWTQPDKLAAPTTADGRAAALFVWHDRLIEA